VKKEYIILSMVIVLLAAYLVLHDSNRSRYELPTVPVAAEKELTKIEIKQADKTLTVTRKANDWTVGDQAWPADAQKVNAITAAISKLRLTALVSTAKVYERYDLTDDKKITVTAWVGDKVLLTFDIGKAADTYQHTFVMLPGDSNVYHAMNNFRKTFETSADDLRDKQVIAVSVAEIKDIKLASEGKTITLSRMEEPVAEEKKKSAETEKPADPAAGPAKDLEITEPRMQTVWKNESGESVDKAVVERFLSNFSDMKCESYLNDIKKEDLMAPIVDITLSGDKKSYAVSVFEKKDGKYSGVSSENAYPFQLREYVVDGINKEIKTLMGIKEPS